ncbi:MAG: NAD(P)H-hydrate dehydratase, partial [Burkholderiales bacterium]|nr:NAD(P)H-hydrate dehydratase [Burkholderiales bacterium]
VAPDARRVWVAAGPGNNGGDGLVAARLLHQQGWSVQVSLLADPARLPADARAAHADAVAAGVTISNALPERIDAELVIDALLGLGTHRAPGGPIAEAIARINHSQATVLAVDLPTGLHADTGCALGGAAVQAAHTVSLLTLKPGLFTAQGRDAAGRVWFDPLDSDAPVEPVTAWLNGPSAVAHRRHAQHKGSFGDVIVLGGDRGMGGAAVLAARAALAAGAGRVYLGRLAGDVDAVDPRRPELMPRPPESLMAPALLNASTVVCGCGGGDAVAALLPTLLHHAARLVLDADALNAIAADASLAARVAARQARGLATVLTPHPLEAARLLGLSAHEVQADRLAAAQRMADRLHCTVLLKGSGSLIAAPGRVPTINATGNARLATAGTGDVLAGWLGGLWSQSVDADDGFASACDAAWRHGRAAERGPAQAPLLAADLIDAMAAAD